ncbi:hypothetical protein NM688_g1963 [Phlebia brevispora]|uniref:Uncharacterized protein n=1 Tax=Phlebia brevispora TaxID=194682 RepID=A0ACC1T9M1_9APHY|nr:hypothetical protein NM688_g1963 [Phlebia brevispora]
MHQITLEGAIKAFHTLGQGSPSIETYVGSFDTAWIPAIDEIRDALESKHTRIVEILEAIRSLSNSVVERRAHAHQDNEQERHDVSQGDPWVTVERTIRGREEDKVRDCKEDVDALLVFAGLFSAVLTPFLILSYQSLQEDPQQTSVVLLRQITSQTSSYTLSNGSLNSTAPPLPPFSPFEAASTDVIINICWFASLILSLSTASFGILVKQWLREYLATDRTAPDERIRILHFRSLGVQEWKLFEIAAILPLVLQLSLALFFVGLCYLASETHPKLRATSLTLVSGWAFLFGLTVLAPLVSARCPYKTTFLKAVFQRVRPYLRKRPQIPTLNSVRHLPSQLFNQLWSSIRKLCNKLARLVQARDIIIHAEIITQPADEEDGMDRSGGSPGKSQHSPYDVSHVIVRTLKDYTLDAYVTALEENEVRTTKQNDLQIFAQVDGVLRDDNLLVGMRRALQQRKSDLYDHVLHFVVSALSSRLDLQTSALPNDTEVLTKVNKLSPLTCLAFINILSDPLQLDDSSAQAYNIIALMLLLGREGPSYLEDMTSVFQHILSKSRLHGWVSIIIRGSLSHNTYQTTAVWQAHVFSTLADALKTLDPSVLRSLVHRTYVNGSEEPAFESKTYARLLDRDMPATNNDTLDPATGKGTLDPKVLEALVRLVISILQGMADGMAGSKILDPLNIPHFKELLQFVFDAFPVPHRVTSNQLWFRRLYKRIFALMTSVLSRPALVSILFECIRAHRGFLAPYLWEYVLQKPAQDAAEYLSADDRTDVLAAITTSFQTPLTTYQALICTSCVPFRPPSSDSDEHRAQLRNAFSLISEAFTKASSLPTASSSLLSTGSDPRTPKQLDELEENIISALASKILSQIDQYSEDGIPTGSVGELSWLSSDSDFDNLNAKDEDTRYYRWRDLFEEDESIYPDELISILRNLSAGNTTKRDGSTFWRIRLLEDKERGDYGYSLGTA